ncbi:hypothetical protein CP532_2846 [Ophiocordyceps camponoti-leonardi (nom. inval.)]|nr:hypothetical protein CP532_2846 [Ophiocordyceps camponoti-leonardi (nom. inval.)]
MAQQHRPGGLKRPRLSLQIRTTTSRTGRPVDPGDPTAFNTLSNAYVAAIETSSAEPMTAINTLQAFSLATPAEPKKTMPRVVTPYVASYPETPLTAQPKSPSRLELHYPSTMTATPPQSAESAPSSTFTFSPRDVSSPSSSTPRLPPQLQLHHPPYSHPRSLHSILRNSPLPPRTAIPPPSPRRQSLRLQEKAAKKVGYNSPLTQEIVTNQYTKSHMELLAEDTSPSSPYMTMDSAGVPLLGVVDGQDQGRIFRAAPSSTAQADEDSTSLEAHASATGRKRRRMEKKRRWVWTIGQEDDEDEDETSCAGTDASTAPASAPQTVLGDDAETPTASIEDSVDTESASSAVDASASDTCSVDWADEDDAYDDDVDDEGRGDRERESASVDLKTPTAPPRLHDAVVKRDTPIPDLLLGRDTPDLV